MLLVLTNPTVKQGGGGGEGGDECKYKFWMAWFERNDNHGNGVDDTKASVYVGADRLCGSLEYNNNSNQQQKEDREGRIGECTSGYQCVCVYVREGVMGHVTDSCKALSQLQPIKTVPSGDNVVNSKQTNKQTIVYSPFLFLFPLLEVALEMNSNWLLLFLKLDWPAW